MINCANGETILLQHDTNLPRPYSLGFRVQGTKGLWMDVNKCIYVEGTIEGHINGMMQKPGWINMIIRFGKDGAKMRKGAGHGGMDFFVLHAFIESIKRKIPTPHGCI